MNQQFPLPTKPASSDSIVLANRFPHFLLTASGRLRSKYPHMRDDEIVKRLIFGDAKSQELLTKELVEQSIKTEFRNLREKNRTYLSDRMIFFLNFYAVQFGGTPLELVKAENWEIKDDMLAPV